MGTAGRTEHRSVTWTMGRLLLPLPPSRAGTFSGPDSHNHASCSRHDTAVTTCNNTKKNNDDDDNSPPANEFTVIPTQAQGGDLTRRHVPSGTQCVTLNRKCKSLSPMPYKMPAATTAAVTPGRARLATCASRVLTAVKRGVGLRRFCCASVNPAAALGIPNHVSTVDTPRNTLLSSLPVRNAAGGRKTRKTYSRTGDRRALTPQNLTTAFTALTAGHTASETQPTRWS